MSLIDRLISQVPDAPGSVGAWLFTYGAIGAATASLLHNFPLSIESLLLWSAGVIGPALVKLKRRRARIGRTPMTEEEEDAAVEALEAEYRTESARIQHMASNDAPPPRHLLH